MSEVAESRSRGEPRSQAGGGPPKSGPGGSSQQQHQSAANNGSENSVQNPGNGGGTTNTAAGTQQDFSWRMGGSAQQQQQMEAYSNFYYPAGAAAAAAGYSPFSGDIRDSIAAIWSRTSPSGTAEGFAAASGGYGQGEGFAAAAAGQFAANLNFATTSELSMFGAAAAGADYSAAAAYGQYGFGPQYTQWPENSNSNSGNNGGGRGGYSYLSGRGGGDLMDVQVKDCCGISRSVEGKTYDFKLSFPYSCLI